METGRAGRFNTSWRACSVAALLAASLGCTSMAAVTNAREQPCQQNVATALSEILVAQGEQPERAQKVVDRADLLATAFDYGPRPFTVSSQSGTDYSLFVEKKGERCLMRLYGRQRGFISYTNNLTYIETRELPGCQCAE